MRTFDNRPWLWLIIGAVLLTLTHMRWGIAPLAFVAPVPLLRYLRLTRGWRSRLLFVGVFAATWTLIVAKICTAPVPLLMAPMFSLPIGAFMLIPYAVWALVQRRLPAGLGALVFAMAGTTAEWLQPTISPMGTWGAAAYTQLGDLVLLQSASLVGIAGVSFVLYLVAAALEAWMHDAKQWRIAMLAGGLLVAAHGFGVWRLSGQAATDMERVAAVGTSLELHDEQLPGEERRAEADRQLFDRTRLAAASGATLIVWPEAGSIVLPDERDAWLEQVSALATELQVEIVAAHVVPLTMEPLTYRNTYVWVLADGTISHEYDKHNPVPGEPVVASDAPLPMQITDGQRRSGAICYDYDFPAMGLGHAALDVDVVALPSSDWQGIDPVHTEMAAVRAIEGGHSVIRSTRWGLSAVVTPTGRMVARGSHFDGPTRVLVADVPAKGRWTVYGLLGDWFVWLCGAGLAILFATARWRPIAVAGSTSQVSEG